jgi:O-antigen ligase
LAVYTPRALAFFPALIGLLAGLYWLFACKEKIAFSRPYLYWMLALGLLWSASSLWSDHSADILEKTVKMLPILLLGVFLFSLPKAFKIEKIRPFLWIFPAGVAVAALLTSIELAGNMPIYRLIRGLDQYADIGTAVMNRSVVTQILCFFPAIVMIQSWDACKRKQIALTACLGTSIFSMLSFTESQSAQLAFFVGLIFFFAFPYRAKIIYPLLTLSMVLLLLSTPWLTQFMFKTLAADASQNAWLSQGYAANRMEIWDFVSRYALENPLYGHGMEATRYVESFKDSFVYHDKASVLHPHNFAVQLWVEFGLVGALFAAAFITFLIKKISVLSTEQRRVCLTVFMTTITTAAISYGLWQSWWLGEFVYLSALCMLVVHLQKNKKEA